MKTEIGAKRLAAYSADSDLDVDIEIRMVQARFADAVQASGLGVNTTAGKPHPNSRGAKPHS